VYFKKYLFDNTFNNYVPWHPQYFMNIPYVTRAEWKNEKTCIRRTFHRANVVNLRRTGCKFLLLLCRSTPNL